MGIAKTLYIPWGYLHWGWGETKIAPTPYILLPYQSIGANSVTSKVMSTSIGCQFGKIRQNLLHNCWYLLQNAIHSLLWVGDQSPFYCYLCLSLYLCHNNHNCKIFGCNLPSYHILCLLWPWLGLQHSGKSAYVVATWACPSTPWNLKSPLFICMLTRVILCVGCDVFPPWSPPHSWIGTSGGLSSGFVSFNHLGNYSYRDLTCASLVPHLLATITILRSVFKSELQVYFYLLIK